MGHGKPLHFDGRPNLFASRCGQSRLQLLDHGLEVVADDPDAPRVSDVVVHDEPNGLIPAAELRQHHFQARIANNSDARQDA